MVTADSGYIEQVGSMIKRIPKHSYHPPTPHNYVKYIAAHMQPTPGYYPIQRHGPIQNSTALITAWMGAYQFRCCSVKKMLG